MKAMQSDIVGTGQMGVQANAPKRGMSRLAKVMVLFVSLTSMAIWSGDALAFNRYAVASTAWNLTSTWAATSGGAAGVSVPVAGDVVFIGETATARNPTIPAGYTAACATLNIGGSGSNSTLTLSANTSVLNVSGTISINRPTTNTRTVGLNVNAGTVNVTGNVVFAGTSATASRDDQITITTGTLNISGDLVLTTGAVNNNIITMSGGAGTINLAGNFTSVAGVYAALVGTLTPGTTSTFNFNGTAIAQTIPIGVSSIIYKNINVNNTSASGATLIAAISAANVTGNVNVQSGILNNGGFAIVGNAGAIFNVASGASFNLTGISAMASGFGTTTFGSTSTVSFQGGNQTIAAGLTYGHLILDGVAASTKTMGTAAAQTITVAGNFTVQGTTTTYNGNTFNPAVNLAGNFTNSATTFNSGTGTFTFSNVTPMAQSLTGATTFSNLAVSNAAGLTINSNVTVGTLLTLTTGKITTGANTLITTAACNAPSVSRCATANDCYVNGNLQKAIPGGVSTCNFEVGDATNYTPVSATFVAGTTLGNLTASVKQGDHPSITASGINANKSINRYWTLTNGGVGLPAAGYSAALSYMDPADKDAGMTTTCTGQRWNGTVWSTRATATCATGAGVSTIAGVNGFGDFAVGNTLGTYKGVNQLIDLREVY